MIINSRFSQAVNGKEDRNLSKNPQNLEKIMNEKMSKRRIQIIDFQKQEIEEKEETTLLIRLHIFYKILLINLCRH